MKTALIATAFLSVAAGIVLWNAGQQALALFLALWTPTIAVLPLVLAGSTGGGRRAEVTVPARRPRR